jgi:hypothetical protein
MKLAYLKKSLMIIIQLNLLIKVLYNSYNNNNNNNNNDNAY